MCVFKNHAFIYFLRPPSWSGTIIVYLVYSYLFLLLSLLVHSFHYSLSYVRTYSRYSCITVFLLNELLMHSFFIFYFIHSRFLFFSIYKGVTPCIFLCFSYLAAYALFLYSLSYLNTQDPRILLGFFLIQLLVRIFTYSLSYLGT